MTDTLQTLKNILESLSITNSTVQDLMRRIEALEKRIARLER